MDRDNSTTFDPKKISGVTKSLVLLLILGTFWLVILVIQGGGFEIGRQEAAVFIPCDQVTFSSLDTNPTFESAGVRVTYSTGLKLNEGDMIVEYKENGSSTWKEGHPMTITSSTRSMGSIFYLNPNTTYDVRVGLDGCPAEAQTGSFSTLSDGFSTGSGTDYYVSKDGDNSSDGLSETTAFGTIQKGADVAQAGDIVHIMPGTYHESVFVKNSGSADAYVLFKAEGDVKVYGSIPNLRQINASNDWILDGADTYKAQLSVATNHVAYGDQRLYNYGPEPNPLSSLKIESRKSDGVDGGYYYDNAGRLYVKLPDGSDPDTKEMHVANKQHGFIIDSKNYIIIEGFEIAYYGTSGASNGVRISQSTNNVVRNNTIHGVDVGVMVDGKDSQNNLIELNEVYDTSIFDWDWRVSKNGDTEYWGIQLQGGKGNVVRGNTVHGFFDGLGADRESQKYDEGWNYSVDIYNNHIYDCRDDGFGPEGALVNVRFWGNTIRNNHNGISFAPVTVGPLYAFRNVIYDPVDTEYNEGAPYKFDTDEGKIYIYHNTHFRLDGRAGFWPSGDADNITMKNNVGYSGGYVFENSRSSNRMDWDYNCHYTTEGASWIKWDGIDYSDPGELYAATGQEEHGINGDPKFVYISGADVNLQPDSPCVDTAVIVPNINDWNYVGDGPDIGALEAGSSQEPPIPTPEIFSSCDLSNYELTEGAVISANFFEPSDFDIYIPNSHCYKRLFLNQAIYDFYGHLNYTDVVNVTPETRDTLPTSGIFRNCEADTEKVYGVEVTGEDTGLLHHISLTGSEAVSQGPDFFKKVFCINNNEFNWYTFDGTTFGVPYRSLSEVPLYVR